MRRFLVMVLSAPIVIPAFMFAAVFTGLDKLHDWIGEGIREWEKIDL